MAYSSLTPAELAETLLCGAYDLHIHSWPSHVERVVDDELLFAEAEAARMAGVVIKNHYLPTGDRALLLNRAHGGSPTRAYGSITLNWPVGGLNPYAMESSLRLGASIVWAPTRDAAHSLTFGNMDGDFFTRPGLTVFTPEQKLKPEVYDLLDLAVSYQVPIATGHLSLEESLALCQAGLAKKAPLLLTHPDWNRTVVPLEIQVELADSGVTVEKCWCNIFTGDCTEDSMMHSIREIGPEHIVLSTDCGMIGPPHPVEGMRSFLSMLARAGFTTAEIRQMSTENPARLLKAEA